jgi:hypothetical protein
VTEVGKKVECTKAAKSDWVRKNDRGWMRKGEREKKRKKGRAAKSNIKRGRIEKEPNESGHVARTE